MSTSGDVTWRHLTSADVCKRKNALPNFFKASFVKTQIDVRKRKNTKKDALKILGNAFFRLQTSAEAN